MNITVDIKVNFMEPVEQDYLEQQLKDYVMGALDEIDPNCNYFVEVNYG